MARMRPSFSSLQLLPCRCLASLIDDAYGGPQFCPSTSIHAPLRLMNARWRLPAAASLYPASLASLLLGELKLPAITLPVYHVTASPEFGRLCTLLQLEPRRGVMVYSPWPSSWDVASPPDVAVFCRSADGPLKRRGRSALLLLKTTRHVSRSPAFRNVSSSSSRALQAQSPPFAAMVSGSAIV